MVVYNIRKSKYTSSLQASGVANRWNRDDEYVIYAGGSISLAALELVAHRNSVKLTSDFKLMFIKLKIKKSDISEVHFDELPNTWKSLESYSVLQKLGSDWYQSNKSLVLKVPSALVHWESNYLINTNHPDFSKKVTLESVEDFEWDQRLT